MQKPKYRPEMVDEVIALGRAGKSDAEIAAHLDITKQTMYNWCSPTSPTYHPEFAEAMDMARTHAEAWWLHHGQAYLVEEHKGPRINARLYQLQTMARFNHGIVIKNQSEEKIELTFGDTPSHE